MKQTGYKMKEYGIPTKRYCQTLDLKDDPELISEYRKRHTENEAWPEILQGIRSVGILMSPFTFLFGFEFILLLQSVALSDFARISVHNRTICWSFQIPICSNRHHYNMYSYNQGCRCCKPKHGRLRLVQPFLCRRM